MRTSVSTADLLRAKPLATGQGTPAEHGSPKFDQRWAGLEDRCRMIDSWTWTPMPSPWSWRTGWPGCFPLDSYVRENLGAHGESAKDRFAGVARQALDELQDYVGETTHDAWPGENSPPTAYAEVRGALLHLWYGGADIAGEIVLACEPVPIAQLRSA